jgi:hypothetical protein
MPTQQWVAPPYNKSWKQGWRNPTMGGPQQLMTQPPMKILFPPHMWASTSNYPRLKLATQPIPNPNNGRPTQPVQDVILATYPTCSISSLDCNVIHLRYRKTLTKDHPCINIEDLNEEALGEELKHKRSQEPSKTEKYPPSTSGPTVS